MFSRFRPTLRTRILSSRFSSLLLLFQRSPIVQMLFPEARVIGGAGLAEITKWSIATVAGLGAFDTVAGATVITQIQPNAGQSTVPATYGTTLSFVFQLTGNLVQARSWSVSGTLPAGLALTDASSNSTSISGIPTEAGSFPITIRAWGNTNHTGTTQANNFTIIVAPIAPQITNQPDSATINSGQTAALSLSVNATGASLSYQWYQGSSGSTGNPVSGATSRNFTTPALTTTTKFWARVTNSAGHDDSSAATVTVVVPPQITNQPDSTTIDSGQTTVLTVAVSGTSPALQWYRGTSGVTTNPISGATGLTFTTPALTATTSYWVKASNAAGAASSNTATVTVNSPFTTWKNNQFSAGAAADDAISGPAADPDTDGLTNQQEYIFGLLPQSRELSPLSAPTQTGDQLALGFTARKATGQGYAGLTRHYTLQAAATPDTASWTALAGYEDIIGNDQPVSYTAPATADRQFYRLSVWLAP